MLTKLDNYTLIEIVGGAVLAGKSKNHIEERERISLEEALRRIRELERGTGGGLGPPKTAFTLARG